MVQKHKERVLEEKEVIDNVICNCCGNALMTDENLLTIFNSGEWCDTKDICRLLNITFDEGLHKFEFSRTAEWNKYPLEGQKIITQFRIK